MSFTPNTINGWQYCLNDKALIQFLNKAIEGDVSSVTNVIPHIKHNDYAPGELMEEFIRFSQSKGPGWAKVQLDEGYFICTPEYHDNKGGCRNRRTGKNGFWQRSGDPKPIIDDDGKEIGSKKYFTAGNWALHEYESNIDHQNKDEYIICKLMTKIGKKRKAKKAETIVETSTSNNAPQRLDGLPRNTVTNTISMIQQSDGVDGGGEIPWDLLSTPDLDLAQAVLPFLN